VLSYDDRSVLSTHYSLFELFLEFQELLLELAELQSEGLYLFLELRHSFVLRADFQSCRFEPRSNRLLLGLLHLHFAAQEMRVHVEGFPEPMATTDPQSGRVMQTEREVRRDDPPIKDLRVTLRDIPVPGPARWVATGLESRGHGHARMSRPATRDWSAARDRSLPRGCPR